MWFAYSPGWFGGVNGSYLADALSDGIRASWSGLMGHFFTSGGFAAFLVVPTLMTLVYVLYRIVNGGKQGG